MLQAKDDVETVVGHRPWRVPRLRQWAPSKPFLALRRPPGYEFMAYLRHHGFPSPLLDWSISPYVTAFFAFRRIPKGTSSVAIFTYQEMGDAGKTYQGSAPMILTLDSSIATDRRHFTQQSRYTVCVQRDKGGMQYQPHEQVSSPSGEDQDIVVKYILPAAERSKVLNRLDIMNINAFTLFISKYAFLSDHCGSLVFALTHSPYV